MLRTQPTPRWNDASAARVTRVYAALLWLCPRGFRESFGVEAAQVFRLLYRDAWAERGAWGALNVCLSALGDLMLSACLEYLALWWGAAFRSWAMGRVRSSAILVFCAYIAFVIVGMAFQKATEDVVKSNVPAAHPGIALAYDLVMAGAVIALLATLAGGLPIAFAALRQAFTARRWGIVALFAVPPLALAAWLGWTWALLNVIVPANQSLGAASPTAHFYIYSWIGVFVLAAIVSVLAVSVAIAHSDIRPELYRFALAPEVGVAVGMLVTVGAIIAWGLQMQTYAPNFLNANDGPVGLQASLATHLVAQIAVMALATLVVIVGVARGFSTPRSTVAS